MGRQFRRQVPGTFPHPFQRRVQNQFPAALAELHAALRQRKSHLHIVVAVKINRNQAAQAEIHQGEYAVQIVLIHGPVCIHDAEGIRQDLIRQRNQVQQLGGGVPPCVDALKVEAVALFLDEQHLLFQRLAVFQKVLFGKSISDSPFEFPGTRREPFRGIIAVVDEQGKALPASLRQQRLGLFNPVEKRAVARVNSLLPQKPDLNDVNIRLHQTLDNAPRLAVPECAVN